MKHCFLFYSLGAPLLLSGLLTTAVAQPTSAPVLYVNDGATTGDTFTTAAGSDATGTGTAAAPYATVNHALAQAGPGTHTIFIDAGTYSERITLNKSISLQGAGTATAQPGSATIFEGGLLPSATQTNETGLLLTAAGGTAAAPLTIADLTLRGYDFGLQTSGTARAHVLVEDVEAVDNRQCGILWNSLAGVQDLTFRRVRASHTAAGSNTTANGAGRGLFLVNGHKADILIEDGIFEGNRRSGVDVNDGSVSNLVIRGCRFAQHLEPALTVLGAAGPRDGSGNFTGPAALIENNLIREATATGMEFKSCTGSGLGSGLGSFVVRGNYIARPAGSSTSLSADKAGIVFIDRDRNVINLGGGVNSDLVTGGAFIQNNIIRGYQADAASVAAQHYGFGLVLEGSQNKAFGNVLAQCQVAIQVQDRPANNTGATPFYDISRNGYLASAGDSIRSNRLDSCATALRGVNLTNLVDASLNWLGGNTASAVRGAVVTLGGPGAGFAEVAAFAPTGRLDYSPFLNSHTDAAATAGFQGRMDYLHVDHNSPKTGAASPLQEGLTLAAENGTISTAAGFYDESVTVTKQLTLTNDGPTTLRDLTLNSPAKVLTLAAPLTLTGGLTLSNGLLRTTATHLLTLADQATASAGNATSYVDGPLRKQGQQAFVFPIGKAGFWARLGISAPASAATAFTAEYVAAVPAILTANAPLSEVSQVEHWTLDGAGTTDAVTVRLHWENELRSGIDDFSSDLQVARLNGSAWETAGHGGRGGALAAGSVVSAQALSSFGPFTLGSLSATVNPLSSQLSAFRAATSQPGKVDLEWTMAGESNTYGYTVERAPDATAWQPIGFVASRGITTQNRTYTYQDQTGLTQPSYRLRQTSSTGSVSYSEVVTVALAPAGATWTGLVSADWATASNWSPSAVPTAASSITIPAGTPVAPEVSTTQTVGSLTIAAGASLTVKPQGHLRLDGNFTNSGTFLSEPLGTVSLVGTSLQTIGGSSTTTFNNLTIGVAGATLASPISVARVLTLNGDLATASQPFRLLSSATGTALVVNAGGTVQGRATMERYITSTTNPGLGYRHFSSPVAATPVADLATPTFTPVVNPAYNALPTPGLVAADFPTVFEFDESRISPSFSGFDYGWKTPTALTAPLEPGRGYTVQLSGQEKVDLSGTLNNGNVQTPSLTNGGLANSGWQLLGNPYPAPIDWDLLSLPTGLSNALYTFRSGSAYSGAYSSYVNGVGMSSVVPAMQGFFVRVTSSQPVALTFTNASRLTTYANPSFYRQTAETRSLLELSARDSQGRTDAAFLYFQAGATAAADNQFDAFKLPNADGTPNLYSLTASGAELAINGQPLLTQAVTVPLGLATSASGTCTLRAERLLNFAPITAVQLEDRLLGVVQDLRQQPTYTFQTTGGPATGRFFLRLGAVVSHTAAGQLAAAVTLYPNPAAGRFTVALAGQAGPATIAVLDALGRVVLTQKAVVSGPTTAISVQAAHLPAGLYVVRVTTVSGTSSQKLLLEAAH